jgi:hypothetical protein
MILAGDIAMEDVEGTSPLEDDLRRAGHSSSASAKRVIFGFFRSRVKKNEEQRKEVNR